jgi:hypothetical protein
MPEGLYIHFLKTVHARWAVLAILCAALSGCGALADKKETGVVIARRAQVRSSSAVVAADLKEVVRGDVVEIIDSLTAENGERWLRVRTRDSESVEGWIEARNIIPQEMIERSRQLAEEDKGIPPQASGQLRANTNIRFTPDRTVNDNILMKLESGARFYIVGWKRVPKPKTSEATDSDDAPKAGTTEGRRGRRGREEAENKAPEDPFELWYKIRLPPSLSPAPAGWVLGKQVELTVPSDIIFYRTGREFVAWQRLDGEVEDFSSSTHVDKDAAKEGRPGSWVILEKSSTRGQEGNDPPDFDRIFVLGYDKERQEHYTAYRSPDLDGRLPLRIEGQGDSKTFTVRVQDGGQLKDVRFRTYLDTRGILKVEPLDELPKAKGR